MREGGPLACLMQEAIMCVCQLFKHITISLRLVSCDFRPLLSSCEPSNKKNPHLLFSHLLSLFSPSSRDVFERFLTSPERFPRGYKYLCPSLREVSERYIMRGIPQVASSMAVAVISPCIVVAPTSSNDEIIISLGVPTQRSWPVFFQHSNLGSCSSVLFLPCPH